MKKRIFTIFLTTILIIGLMPINVFAAKPIHVLALGDSITTGYGLQDAKAERFTALLGENYIITNKAIDGNTITGIAKQLQTGAISKEMISSADVITITAGGNDMMAFIHTKMAEIYNAKNHTSIHAADISKIINGLNRSNLIQNYTLLGIEAQLLNKENINYFINSQEFTNALYSYQQMLIKTTTFFKRINPNALIIVATQYNPYAEFANNALFKPFYHGIEEGMVKLNEVITTGATAGGYTIADVKAAFDNRHSNTFDLYNANPNLTAFNLDLHPNSNGHILLAEVFKQTIEKNIPINNTPSINNNIFEDVSSDSYYAKAVSWATESKITAGISKTAFCPDAACTRAQVVTFLWRTAGSPAPKSTKIPFTDVPADSYYHDAILWAIENNITAGTSDTSFSPDAKCSRGQIVTFLWRTQKSPIVSGTNVFHDIEENAYYNNAIQWAVNQKIASGTSEDTFSPNTDCTRGQIVTFLWRFLNNK